MRAPFVVFAFDNASNHSCFASDTLRVEGLNKGTCWGLASYMGGIYSQQRLAADNAAPQNYRIRELAGKSKDLRQILKEYSLWDREYYACCPRSDGRPGCRPQGWCYARKILAAERDFLEQKGRLQEEIEARGHKVIFFLKFYCELDPTEGYWCKAKWYTREHCD